MNLFKKYILVLFSIVLLLSCSEYEKVLKADYSPKKYDMAMKMYKKHKFLKAIPLFEEVISLESKFSAKGEESYYYLCYSHYNIQSYNLAGYYFNNFAVTYPQSTHAEEAVFMSANCKVNTSPKYSLDQGNTTGAIQELQSFLKKYPNSTRKDTCVAIIDQLQGKLENKAYENAMLYYKMEDYHAASTSLSNILKDYPDIEYREKILYYVVKSNYNLANNSVKSKKTERFEETIKSYTKFVDNFPQSKKISELEIIYKSAQRKLILIK